MTAHLAELSEPVLSSARPELHHQRGVCINRVVHDISVLPATIEWE